jgi:hypothetical protein
MNDTERLLEEAGETWRASQRTVPEINPAVFAQGRSRPSPANSFVAGAIGATLVLVVGAATMQLGIGPGIGGPPPLAPTVQPVQPSLASIGSSPSPSPSASVSGSATGGKACAVTRPIPIFVPPSPFLASPPARYRSDWFGSAALWTMINHDGEIWKQSSLPHNPEGLTQKTFWWSADWPAGAEPEPAITVVGTRLDGSGTFVYSPGTNAGADFGTAMLVGIDFPSPGCWQLTGRYRDAVLSYVVWITDD